MGEKVPDLGRALGAPWYIRLGLKLGRGGVVAKVGKLFEGRPGLTRTILALYIAVTAILHAVGLQGPAELLTTAWAWLGLTQATAGAPVDTTALSAAVDAFVTATLGLIAIVRPLVRWVMAAWKKTDLGSVTPPGPLASA